MSDLSSNPPSLQTVEEALRKDLELGNAIIVTARPILRQLLAQDDQALFSDEVIARIRGMVRQLARQVLLVLAEEAGIADRGGFADAHEAALIGPMLADSAFLAHAHALTIETNLAARLHQRSGIDPVLSPLVQEQVASTDPATAALAMQALAAQARFIEQQRRMHLPLAELPGDLLHALLQSLRGLDAAGPQPLAACEARLRAQFSESERRVGLFARLLMAMDRKAVRALAIDHAGLAIFLTALAMASEQERDLAAMALVDSQFARLALALRAVGLSQAAVEEQFLYLHPDVTLPDGFASVTADRANALLASLRPELAD